MLVFGESILNDAVAIVLTNVIVESKRHIENINTTKLTAYSMIGLLASSNLTTMPSATTTHRNRHYNNELSRNEGQPSIFESGGDLAALPSNENNRYPVADNENEDNSQPDILNDFSDDKNIPAKKKRRKSNFSKQKYSD